MVLCILTQIFGKSITLLVLRDISIGFTPFQMLILGDSALGELYNVFIFIPTAIVYGKMIPENIEATVYALLAGLNVVANYFVNRMLGNFINLFVGVDKDSLEDFWKLQLICVIMAFLPFLFICVVPSDEDIDDSQQVVIFMDEY